MQHNLIQTGTINLTSPRKAPWSIHIKNFSTRLPTSYLEKTDISGQESARPHRDVQINFCMHCHPQTFPFLAATFFTVSSLYDAYITQNNETAKENWKRPRTTASMALHKCSRLSNNFSENFPHPLLPSLPLEKLKLNAKRTLYHIPCFETLRCLGHHMSKYQLVYFRFPTSNLSVLANVLLHTKMATFPSPLRLNTNRTDYRPFI